MPSLRQTCLTSLLAVLLGIPSIGMAAATISWCSKTGQASLLPGMLRRNEPQLSLPPAPQALIHTEGTLPHQGIFDQSVEAKRDWPRMRDFALIWYYTSDSRYLEALTHYLDAWTALYQPSFNPIDETELDALIDSYAISQQALPLNTERKVSALLRDLAEGYIQRIRQAKTPRPATFVNNWNSHRIKLITLSALALQDQKLLSAARSLYLAQIANNIDADGQTLDYGERDALHYVSYDLEPLVRAALAAKMAGQDWLNLRGDHGGSLQQALEWLRPYAEGKLQHLEFVHTKVKFDLVRREAGLPGYSGYWQPASSRNLYALAARLSPAYRDLALSLGRAPDWIGLCWP